MNSESESAGAEAVSTLLVANANAVPVSEDKSWLLKFWPLLFAFLTPGPVWGVGVGEAEGVGEGVAEGGGVGVALGVGVDEGVAVGVGVGVGVEPFIAA